MNDTSPGFESETILRVEAIDKKRRDKSEREPEWRRSARGAFYVLLGTFLLYVGASRLIEEGISLPVFSGGMMGCFAIFLAIRTFRRKPSIFAAMDRYIFTDQRIALVDSCGTVIDEIPADQLGDMTCDKRYEVTIHRADDPTRDRILPIIYIADYSAVRDFIADNYRILSHEPAGWPRDDLARDYAQGTSP